MRNLDGETVFRNHSNASSQTSSVQKSFIDLTLFLDADRDAELGPGTVAIQQNLAPHHRIRHDDAERQTDDLEFKNHIWDNLSMSCNP